MKYNLYLFVVLCLFMPLNGCFSAAQDSTVSLAFKKNRPPASYPLYYAPDLSYKLLQQFELIRGANSGDALAQHELGLRYLQGSYTTPDTLKAAEWIGKAALQNLPAACYNYAILLLNGWGVKWDPFDAFLNFKKAAEDGMPQAQYIVGLFYTENFVVKRDLKKAAEWLGKAEEKEFKPASETLNQLKKNTKKTTLDTSSSGTITGNSLLNNSPLVYIDFDAEEDTSEDVSSDELLKALFLSGNEKLIESGKTFIEGDSLMDLDKINLEYLNEAADYGSPEAVSLIGYMYEHGITYPKDPVMAGIYYFTGTKLDSRHSAFLLWKLNRSFNLYKELEKQVKENNQRASYLLYAMRSFNLTDLVSDEKARELLFSSAASGNNYALLEAGLNSYSGQYTDISISDGYKMIKESVDEGNLIAEQRLISILIIDSLSLTSEQFLRLQEMSKKGSIISETLIGYCYSRGIGVSQSMPEAVKYFRQAAQRGSIFAFRELENIYDNLRPDNEIFSIEN